MPKIQLPTGKEVEVQNPKGRDTKKGLKLMMAMEEEEATSKALNTFTDFVAEIAVKYSGFTADELDGMDCDDMNAIYGHYEKKINDRLDFLTTLSKSQS